MYRRTYKRDLTERSRPHTKSTANHIGHKYFLYKVQLIIINEENDRFPFKIMEIKSEDSMSFSYQSADSSQSKAVPPAPAGDGPLCFKL